MNAGVVAALGAGRSHVDDLSDADVAEMLAGGFQATTDESLIATAGTAVICVPTPLAEGDGPDLRAVIGATEAIGRNLRPGMLVVLESTTYPGTTDEVVRPLLEKLSGLTAGIDFHLAFSPERIDPGNERYGARNTPKVVGGYTAGCADRVADVLRAVRRHRRADQGHPGGGDREAAGEHVPACEHRAGQRDGAVLPRARHRPVGRHPRGVDQAVRLPGRSTRGRAWAGTASRSTRTT